MIGNPMGNVLGNPLGNPLGLAAGNSTTKAVIRGEVSWTTPGTYEWVVPKGVTSICAVCIGTGGASSTGLRAGGGGGAVAYKNNIAVNPGQTLKVVVGALSTADGVAGGDTFITDAATPGVMLVGAGGGKTAASTAAAVGGAVLVGDGGTAGGQGANGAYAGNGGAGGYLGAAGGAGVSSGQGGQGGVSSASGGGQNPNTGGGRGGGQWLYGTEGWPGSQRMAGGFSGNYDYGVSDGKPMAGFGIFFGAGGYAGDPASGSSGAVRILWGEGRAFPATNVGLNS